MNWEADIPSIETIESNWPLEAKSFTYNHKNIPPEPHALQPKLTFHKETFIDYYVSPRKFIRYANSAGHGFLLSDVFEIQYLTTIT
jgi:hypothetical protein